MDAVYIVTGRTGSYEDYTEWIAGVFKSEEKATKYLKECEKYAYYASEMVEDGKGDEHPRYYNDEVINSSPDNRFQIQYTGTYYEVHKEVLLDRVC